MHLFCWTVYGCAIGCVHENNVTFCAKYVCAEFDVFYVHAVGFVWQQLMLQNKTYTSEVETGSHLCWWWIFLWSRKHPASKCLELICIFIALKWFGGKLGPFDYSFTATFSFNSNQISTCCDTWYCRCVSENIKCFILLFCFPEIYIVLLPKTALTFYQNVVIIKPEHEIKWWCLTNLNQSV